MRDPLLDLEDELDLDRRIERQGVHSDRSSRVTPRITEHFHHEIAGAIGHGRLGIESRITLDEDPQPHDPANPLELAAERRLRDRKSVDRALPGSGRREIDGNLGWDGPVREQLPILKRDLPAHHQKIPALHGGQIRGDRARRFWQRDSKIGKTILDGTHVGFLFLDATEESRVAERT